MNGASILKTVYYEILGGGIFSAVDFSQADDDDDDKIWFKSGNNTVKEKYFR